MTKSKLDKLAEILKLTILAGEVIGKGAEFSYKRLDNCYSVDVEGMHTERVDAIVPHLNHTSKALKEIVIYGGLKK